MPKGRDYMLVVDCKKGHCEAVKDHMRGMGFKVRKNHTSLGDHNGIKHFDTEREANSTAERVYADCPDQIWQIVVFPDE